MAGFVVGLGVAYWTDSLYLDFSFVIWFWMGSELKRGNPAARKWAIGISGVVTVFIVAMVVTGTGEATFGNLRFEPGDARYYLMGGGLFVLLGLPGLLLLSRGAREEFLKG